LLEKNVEVSIFIILYNIIKLKIFNLKALSAADRSNLIHDAFSLAKADDVPYGIALNKTKYLSLEHHYVPWEVAATNLNRLSEHIYLRPVHKNLEVRLFQN